MGDHSHTILGIPPELRSLIYDELVRENRPIRGYRSLRVIRIAQAYPHWKLHPQRLLALGLSCKGLRAEIIGSYPRLLHVFLQDNTFFFNDTEELALTAPEITRHYPPTRVNYFYGEHGRSPGYSDLLNDAKSTHRVVPLGGGQDLWALHKTLPEVRFYDRDGRARILNIDLNLPNTTVMHLTRVQVNLAGPLGAYHDNSMDPRLVNFILNLQCVRTIPTLKRLQLYFGVVNVPMNRGSRKWIELPLASRLEAYQPEIVALHRVGLHGLAEGLIVEVMCAFPAVSTAVSRCSVSSVGIVDVSLITTNAGDQTTRWRPALDVDVVEYSPQNEVPRGLWTNRHIMRLTDNQLTRPTYTR